jgi:hypothetical protein
MRVITNSPVVGVKLAGVLFAVLGLAIGGCPRSKGPEACTGSVGCSCVPSQGCDPGLTCVSGKCSRSIDGVGPHDGASPAETAPPAEEVQPLSPESIVFAKRLRRGEERRSSGVFPLYAYHLYAFDLSQRSERLITNLDDDGSKPGINPSRFAISPDRRWIAFGSSEFRHTLDDRKLGFTGPILWRVSADGKQFRRLTQPNTEQLDKGGACSGEMECLRGETCQSGVCTRTSLSVSYSDPLWAPDGKTVYFQERLSWLCPAGLTDIHYCLVVRARSAQPPALDGWRAPIGCTAEEPWALSRDGQSLLVHRHNCVGRSPGLFELTSLDRSDTPTEGRAVARFTGTGTLNPVDAAWLPDGSGVLLVAQADVTKTTKNSEFPVRYFRQGLYLWKTSGETKPLYEPESDLVDVAAVTVTPSGQAVVEIVRHMGGPANSHLHLFDVAGAKLGDQLTRDGDNVEPRW